MKEWYSAAELAVLRLPNWPSSRFGVQKRCEAEGRESREVLGRLGGGKGGVCVEYRLSISELADLVLLENQRRADLLPAPQPQTLPVAVTLNVAQLADWQRQCAEARLIIVREVERRVHDGMRKTKAVMSVVHDAAAGTLPEGIQEVVTLANARAGDVRAISRRSLFDWLSIVDQAADRGLSAIAVLAPRTRPPVIPAWASHLMQLYQQPQNPALAAVMEVLPSVLPAGVAVPSYGQAYRFITEQVGAVEREKGRMGSRELKNIKPFVRRDTTALLPTDVYTADGHCFDAEVAHPQHGRPFRPEITTVIDVATRLVVGFSVDLAESGWAVLDAIRLSATNWGIPALFYVDNGSGYQNDMMKAQGRGIMARLGTEMTHSLPYNSQARGIIERSHQTLWVKAAKNLPSYMGADMDSQAKQKAFKVTRRDIKAVGTSKLLIQWDVFLEYARAAVEDYNSKPHSALPKITDRTTMKKRHLSPLEAWQKAVADGAEILKIDASEANDLFRPSVLRTVRRGEIDLFGNKYFSQDLEQYHGQEMTIEYDIHDPERVWVRDDDGRLVAVAGWNANKTAYFPVSVRDRARQNRAKGRLRLLAAKQHEALEEAGTKKVLEHIHTQTLPIFGGKDLATVFAEIDATTPAPNNIVPFKAVFDDAPTPVAMPEDKLGRWVALDDRVNAGEQLEEKDFDFWSLFPKGKTFRELTEDKPELRQRAANALGKA